MRKDMSANFPGIDPNSGSKLPAAHSAPSVQAGTIWILRPESVSTLVSESTGFGTPDGAYRASIRKPDGGVTG